MGFSDAYRVFPRPIVCCRRTIDPFPRHTSMYPPPPHTPFYPSRLHATGHALNPNHLPTCMPRCCRSVQRRTLTGPSMYLTSRRTPARVLTAPRSSTATNKSHTTSATASSWRTSTRTRMSSSTRRLKRDSLTHKPTATPTATNSVRKWRANHLRPVPFSRSPQWT